MLNAIKRLHLNKKTKTVLIFLLAFGLLVAVWLVFFQEEERTIDKTLLTEEELRLTSLLQSIDGITQTNVYITQEGDVPVCAVIIFHGKDSLILRKQILAVTASALQISQKDVTVVFASNLPGNS